MDTIDLDEDLTPDEASAARPYAIEALRELGVQLSENDRDDSLLTPPRDPQ